jgi:hypothetical protein
MDNYCALLKPEVLTSGTFDDDIRYAKSCFDEGIETYEEPIKRELEDIREEMKHWKERKENDKRHLDSLLKAKKETDVSGPVNLAKATIIPLFEDLTAYFRGLAKTTGDNKAIKETYTKVISYIHNQPLDKKDACGHCAKTNDAYHYIKEQFAKEDKWVKILEDQMLVSKLHTKDDHDKLGLDGVVDDSIIEMAQQLHSLNFTFENELVFRTNGANDANKVYEDVKYAGKVITLNIFGEKTSAPTLYV